jgi:hypothetical protein
MTKYLVTLDYETDAENPDNAIEIFTDAFADYLMTGIVNKKLIVTVRQYVEKDTREGRCKVLKFKAKKTRH